MKKWICFFLFSSMAVAEEVSPALRSQSNREVELEQNKIDFKKEQIPQDKKGVDFNNRTLIGSSFTYGNNSSIDLDLDTQSSLDYNKHRLENVLEYYTYWLNPDNGPTQRYKGRFNGSLKYLYEIVQRLSPFVSAKIEQTFERVNSVKNYTEKHSYDVGLRYDYNTEDKEFYFISELSNRLIVENAPNLTNSYHNLRVYLASYYYPKPLGLGLWIETISPYEDMADYWVNFGPDVNYTFPGTSFFIGLMANCSVQGKEKYDGDALFDIWSGSFYTGIKF